MLFLLFALLPIQAFSNCEWPQSTSSSSHGQWLEFEVDSASFLSHLRDSYDLPEDFANSEWRQSIISQVDVDPISLLNRQREIFRQALPGYLPAYDRVIDGSFGQISSIHCLEGLLYLEHWRQQSPMLPSEFETLVLQNQATTRVLFFSTPDLGISESGRDALIKESLQQGFLFMLHIHNHPFVMDNPSGDIAGTTIPSGDQESGDVSFYGEMHRNYGLEAFRISNGFSTISVGEEQFSVLKNWIQ